MSSRFDRDPSIDKMLENDIRESFDKITPNEYMRQSILSDIEERDERSSGRKTAMQRLFAVRKVCVACIIVIVMIALSGGTYSAVSMINGEKEEKKSEEIDNKNDEEENEDVTDGDYYRDRLVNFLYGKETAEYQFAYKQGFVNNFYQITDYRMAEAFEGIDTEYQKLESTDAEYTYVGMIAGEGIADMIFDKSEYHVFAAFVREYKEEPDWEKFFYGEYDYMPYERAFVTRKAESKMDEYEKIMFKKYSMECVGVNNDYDLYASYMIGNYEYNIIDLTSYLKYDDKEAIYCIRKPDYMDSKEVDKCTSMDEYVEDSIMLDMKELTKDAPDYTYLTRYEDEYMNKRQELEKNNVSDDNFDRDREEFLDKQTEKAEKFAESYPNLLYSKKGLKCAGVLSWDSGTGAGIGIIDTENLSRKRFLSMENIKLETGNMSDTSVEDSIESITISVKDATIYKKMNMSREEERLISNEDNLGSKMSNYDANGSIYDVYMNCDKSITIPYSEIKKTGLYDYGICFMQNSLNDIKECKSFWELEYMYNEARIENAIDENIRIIVLYTDGSEEEFKVHINNATLILDGYLGGDGLGYNLAIISGWEQIR